jgi:hypothetical protein
MSDLEKPKLLLTKRTLMPWEKRYGYINLNSKTWRSIFPPADVGFTLFVGNRKLFERYVDRLGRVYIGRTVCHQFNDGDLLTCYQDKNGDYHIERIDDSHANLKTTSIRAWVRKSVESKKAVATLSSYTETKSGIPVDLRDDSYLSIDRPPPLRIYLLGFQPAKSIPEIPRWFLHKYASPSPTFKVLEPFSGSGTTLIEALQYGTSVYWLDYHPLSRLICRVKTREFSCSKIRLVASKILKNAEKSESVPHAINFANKDFWFQRPVQEALEILRSEILKTDADLRPALQVAFASTVRKVSNMNDGMILAARRTKVEKLIEYSRSDVYGYFRRYAEKTVNAIEQWNLVAKSKFRNAVELQIDDARKLRSQNEFDAIVTSPPYINAIDYVWASKFELHWLGLVRDDKERLNLYEREIGTERIPKEEWMTLGCTGHSSLDALITDIYHARKYIAGKGQNQLRARVVYKYFMDMKEHFSAAFRCLREGGYYCFTVGDGSRICGVDIPVASTLSDIASEAGFEKMFQFHILLKNRRLNLPRNVEWAGTIKHDTTVVLRKPEG